MTTASTSRLLALRIVESEIKIISYQDADENITVLKLRNKIASGRILEVFSALSNRLLDLYELTDSVSILEPQNILITWDEGTVKTVKAGYLYRPSIGESDLNLPSIKASWLTDFDNAQINLLSNLAVSSVLPIGDQVAIPLSLPTLADKLSVKLSAS